MKTASILASALILISASALADDLSKLGMYVGRGDAQKAVKIGDFSWGGIAYVNASATLRPDGNISVTSAWIGTRIPPRTAVIAWDKAPWDLKKKLQPARDVFEQAKNGGDSRLGATERTLTERYGKPEPHPNPIAPAQRALLYSVDGLRITAHFVDGRAECLFVIKGVGNFTNEDAIRMLAQCGGLWTPVPKVNDMWRRADGGFAVNTGSLLRIETGSFYKASRAKPGEEKSAVEAF